MFSEEKNISVKKRHFGDAVRTHTYLRICAKITMALVFVLLPIYPEKLLSPVKKSQYVFRIFYESTDISARSKSFSAIKVVGPAIINRICCD